MTDPYKVLGVSQNATDDQVKTAYREMARKYHPDNYANNPLADLAQEKMKEINEAYDTIQKMRKGGNTATNGYGGYAGEPSQFADIRRLIQSRRISEAEELLEGIPADRRDAEWYFLTGNIYYSKGWLDEAYNNFLRATNMNPMNPEYKMALQRLMMQRSTGRPMGSYQGDYRTEGPQVAGCSACNLCTSVICANLCCNCYGDFCC